MTDVWFAGGLVVDGSGKDPASVDVCVTDNVITSIGKAPAGAETVELDGRLLTPGLIDAHVQAFAAPDMAAAVVKDGQIAKDIR